MLPRAPCHPHDTCTQYAVRWHTPHTYTDSHVHSRSQACTHPRGGTTSILTLGAAVLGSPGPGPSQHCAPQESPQWGLVSPSEDVSPALTAGALAADSVPSRPGSCPHVLFKHKPVSGGPPPPPPGSPPSTEMPPSLVVLTQDPVCGSALCGREDACGLLPLLGVGVAVALWGDDGTAVWVSRDIMGRAPEVTPLGKLSLSQSCPPPRASPIRGRGVTWGARLPPAQSCWVSAWDPRSFPALSPAAASGTFLSAVRLHLMSRVGSSASPGSRASWGHVRVTVVPGRFGPSFWVLEPVPGPLRSRRAGACPGMSGCSRDGAALAVSAGRRDAPVFPYEADAGS